MRVELINYTKSGDTFWVEVDIVPMADTAGVVTHWVCVHRNIAKRKRVEQALADAAAESARLLQEVNELNTVLDRKIAERTEAPKHRSTEAPKRWSGKRRCFMRWPVARRADRTRQSRPIRERSIL